MVDIVVGGAEHETIVGMAFGGGQCHFFLQQLCGGCLRFGVGHVDERSHATCYGGGAFGGHVGFFGETRLAEMHVRVDDSGNQYETFGIDGV